MAAVMESHVQIANDSDKMETTLEEVNGDDDASGEEEISGEEGESDGSSEEGDGEDDDDEDDGDEEDDADGVVAEKENDAIKDDDNPNAGWAEAMAKILGKKTPENASGILVKNKELEKMKKKEKEAKLEKKKQVDQKRTWEMMCRVKPDIVRDREAERAMQRIATRGVVQLFNAVRQHQKTVDDKVKQVGGSERKKVKILSAVSKKDFIDVLRGTGKSQAKLKVEDAAEAGEGKPGWSVLRDDFMMGASMKDWDKDSDKEEPETEKPAEDMDSD